jgi:propanol-preferring alcohol dehydrogenase
MVLPEPLNFMDGAIIACAGGTAFSMARKMNLSGLTPLALFGAGPLGLCLLIVAKICGAPVIVVDVNQERLAFAEKLGADHCINPVEKDTVSTIKKLTGGRGAPRVVDTSGNTQGRANAVLCAEANGRLGFLGMRNPDVQLDLDTFIRRQLTLIGSYTFPITLYPEITEFMIQHGIHFSDIVTRTFRLEQAEEAYRLFLSGSVGKFMFVWD